VCLFQIFNCDEIGWTGRKRANVKVVAPKQGHVFRKRLTGTGHLTANVCVSASGQFLPTLVIFPVIGSSLTIINLFKIT